MSKELSIKSAEGSFLALKAECEQLESNCKALTITDDLSLKIVTQQYSLLNDKIKEIESKRVEIKAPYLEAGKQIDSLAKELNDPLKLTLEGGRKKILSYNVDKKQKAKAEQNRINEIKGKLSKYSADAIAAFNECKTEAELSAKRDEWVVNFPGIGETIDDIWQEFIEDAKSMRLVLNDFCKNKRIIINAPAEADETVADVIHESITESIAEIGTAEIEKAEYVAPKNITGKFTFEVVDLSLVPREYLQLDESAVKKFIKENSDKLSDGLIEGGLKFIWTENVRIK